MMMMMMKRATTLSLKLTTSVVAIAAVIIVSITIIPDLSCEGFQLQSLSSSPALYSANGRRQDLFSTKSSPSSSSSSSALNYLQGEEEDEHQQQDQLLFFICAYTSFFACLITIVFIPETNNLNLLELDIQWNSIVVTKQHEQQQQQYKEGKGGQQQCQLQRNNSYINYHYNGPANHPDHLSLYEQWRIKKQ
mmetsp:Transcript_11719/g.12580  ORF Transcript_11719/g.12580 Transcript_11719/m.12580 type:complete len:192 (-) Transcript_11719:111-686(-)